MFKKNSLLIFKALESKKRHLSYNLPSFYPNICNNSIRQLINYLEKFKILNTKITCKKVKEICTNISFYEFEQYTNAWFNEKDINKAIKTITADAYLEKLYALSDKRWQQLDGYGKQVKRQKLFQYLAYRGWETELIYQQINRLSSED